MQNDWTPLHLAASSGHTAVVEVLLKSGAAIDETDEVRSHICFNALLYHCVTLFGNVFLTF